MITPNTCPHLAQAQKTSRLQLQLERERDFLLTLKSQNLRSHFGEESQMLPTGTRGSWRDGLNYSSELGARDSCKSPAEDWSWDLRLSLWNLGLGLGFKDNETTVWL